jgi:6-phosphogluconolactonase (cycloisomerase 2 family)
VVVRSVSSPPSNATQENSAGQILSFLVHPDGSLAHLSSVSRGGDGSAYLGFSDDGAQVYSPNVCGSQSFILQASLKLGVFPKVWQWPVRKSRIIR